MTRDDALFLGWRQTSYDGLFRPTRSRPVGRLTEPVARVHLTPESRRWPRRVGALAWVVFEELALSAELVDDTWTYFGGVRVVGSALGITKDTAARAVAALIDAGLLTRELRESGSPSRIAYRVHPLGGVELCPERQDGHRCPDDQDTISRPETVSSSETRWCPDVRDSSPRPDDQDSVICHDVLDSEARPNVSETVVRNEEQDDQPCPYRGGLDVSGGPCENALGDAVAGLQRVKRSARSGARRGAENVFQGRLFGDPDEGHVVVAVTAEPEQQENNESSYRRRTRLAEQ